MGFQRLHHVLNRVYVRQTGFEQSFIILAELWLLPLMMNRIARAFLEHTHRNACHDDFSQTVIWLFFPTLRNRLNLLIQVRKMVVNGFFEPTHQVPLLLTLPVLASFALRLFFALASSLKEYGSCVIVHPSRIRASFTIG